MFIFPLVFCFGIQCEVIPSFEDAGELVVLREVLRALLQDGLDLLLALVVDGETGGAGSDDLGVEGLRVDILQPLKDRGSLWLMFARLPETFLLSGGQELLVLPAELTDWAVPGG